VGNSLSWDLILHNKGKAGASEFAGELDGLKSKAKTAAKGIGAALAGAGAVGGGLLAKGFADNMNIEVGQKKLQGQLGLTVADSKKAGEAAAGVYGENWGESMDEVDDAIRSVGQNIGDVTTMSAGEIKKVTEQALALSSTMGTDVALSTEAVGALMKNGLAKNSTEAFDIITAGMQNGANKADDLLETFQEYSPQFKKLGFDGKYSLDLLSAGLKAGARDTDVIADAFKELSIRAIDGSKTTVDAFKSLGLKAKATGEDFAAGGQRAQQATQKVMEKIQAIKDPMERNRVGVELFGTQWEDTVSKILPALINADGAIEKVDGSTQRMADTVGDTASGRIETMKRKFEQWTQQMASSDSVLGTTVTALGAFGGGAVGAATSAATMAQAVRGTALAEKSAAAATVILNGGLKALKFAWVAALGPAGLIAVAVIAVGAALIYAYKHSEKFRTVVNFAFKAVATSVLRLVDLWLHGFSLMFAAMGKLPGKAGAPFRAAGRAVDGMRAKVKELSGAINRLHGKEVRVLVRTEYRDVFDSEVNRDRATANRGRAGGGATPPGEYIVGEFRPERLRIDGQGRARVDSRVPGAIAAGRSSGAGSSGGNTYVTNHLHVNGSVIGTHSQLKAAMVEAFERAPSGTRGLPASAVRKT
jgi:phage-related minor tail protein